VTIEQLEVYVRRFRANLVPEDDADGCGDCSDRVARDDLVTSCGGEKATVWAVVLDDYEKRLGECM
jgi:hypothetical protein